MIRIRIWLYGRVQGVTFRSSARHEARALGLSGYARNDPDGSLVIEVEGGCKAVDSFVEWARRGPVRAVVEHIAIRSLPVMADDDFLIN